MAIQLKDIQPLEAYLCKEAVDFFMKEPSKLFKRNPQIEIYEVIGKPFKYVVAEGHHRLMASYRLGIMDIPIEPKKRVNGGMLKRASKVRSGGIKSFKDLGNHLLPDFICANLQY